MKKITIIAILIVIAAVSVYLYTSLNNKNTVTSYQDISPADAKELLEKDKDAILLDVRTPEEYEQLHIPNSLLLPLSELEQKAEAELKNKNSPILVYCRSGNRSVTASNILVKLGYKKVYNLGGIIDWPYETEFGK